MTLLFTPEPPSEASVRDESTYAFVDVMKATGTSTELLLIGTKYETGFNRDGTATRDKKSERKNLLEVVALVSSLDFGSNLV
jgi:hypothetical protein